jgi:diguanylate cyclase (GGDEF)-like protein
LIKAPSFIKESTAFVRKLLLLYWLAAAVLLGLSQVALNLASNRQNMLLQADSATNLVESLLATPVSTANRQFLIEAYVRNVVGQGVIGLDVLFVVNREGRIVYSSKPAWRDLMIYDGLFRRAEFANSRFRGLATCFQGEGSDCVTSVSSDFPALDGSVTTYHRPVFRPSPDLGLPREPFLVVATFSGSIAFTALMQDILPQLLLSLVIAGVLSAGLWFAIRGLLLPRLSEAAQTDGLTRLMNRAAFMERALEALAEAEQRGSPLVFAILDVDHFKRINDSYGHDCGDVALVSVSAVLATVMRADDLICRFGGEEFAMLLATDEQAGPKVLERLRLQLEMSRVAYNGREIPVTVSIGAAASSECGYNLDYLYTSADRCLYAAKRGGRNRVEWTRSESVGRLQLSATDDQDSGHFERLSPLLQGDD